MNDTVVWRPTAERALAHIWNDAVDRQAAADAANLMDAILDLVRRRARLANRVLASLES